MPSFTLPTLALLIPVSAPFRLSNFYSHPKALHSCPQSSPFLSRDCYAVCCQTPPLASALDNIPSAVKLNAVAEALARRRDYTGALRVLQEMSVAGIYPDAPTLRAIIDAAITAPSSLADIFCTVPPPGYASSTFEPIGGVEDQHSKIDPTRLGDLSVGAAFMVVLGGAVAIEIVEPVVLHHGADEATSVLIMIMTGLLYDRYGGGEGRVWNRIVKGLGRLFADDPVRKVRVDAAYFVVAYLLGVPWMCYRPDVQQIFRAQRGRAMKEEELQRYLVWVVAGVAMEDEFDGRLIESSLNGARALLKKGTNAKREEIEDRVAKATVQAKKVLRQNKEEYADVVENMLSGGSVGDCVAILAKRFSRT